MGAQENLALVGTIYERFGTGDIPGVLELMTDDVEWVNPGPEAQYPAYFGTKNGKDGALQVFGFIGATYNFSVFNPHTFFANETQVAALLRIEATIASTGKPVAFDGVHLFTVRDGKVCRFQDFQDSYQLSQAFAS